MGMRRKLTLKQENFKPEETVFREGKTAVLDALSPPMDKKPSSSSLKLK
jgi:hypothetical protein